MENIVKVVELQRDFFQTGVTLELKFRLEQLDKLKNSIEENLDTLLKAFKSDFNKLEYDVFTTEVGLVLQEIKYMRRHLKSFARPKRKSAGLLNFPGRAWLVPQPRGSVLIMSPWNYPFQLAMLPLVGALASGNTAIVKPSAYAPKVSACIAKILSIFDKKYVAVVLGGREQNQQLLDQKFDLIFFTGGKDVGRLVQQKASVHLCPVVLELGGKSPCIVDESCDLKAAVRRIVWGKFLNAGQTCVAPDYILVHQAIYEQFLEIAKQQTLKFFFTDGKVNSDFPYIINEKHAERISGLIDSSKVILGGKRKKRQLEPTIMRDVSFDDPVMQEEIFGPIMPVLSYSSLDDVLAYINKNDLPLALYYFGKDRKNMKKIICQTRSGAVCINETVMHVATNTLPFGGVGESGMGRYHGKFSLETFSHIKPVLHKCAKHELKLKYPPLSGLKRAISYKFLGIKKSKKSK